MTTLSMTVPDRITTLYKHIVSNQPPGARGRLSSTLNAIGIAAASISWHARRGDLGDVLGSADRINVQGETVQKLDEYADTLMTRMLCEPGTLAGLGSEEKKDIMPLVPTVDPGIQYIVMFDPLDGSGNIDYNGVIGTIFSVLARACPSDAPLTLEECLQPGRMQVAAGYAIYGPSTQFVYTTPGVGVHAFTLDPVSGQFILTKEDLQMPQEGSILAVNSQERCAWPEHIRSYFDSAEGRTGDAALKTRNWGSMVGDVHRTLMQGGIFMYPCTMKKPDGKLRLLYECNPMALLIENAGGLAVDAKGNRILDIMPESLHQRTSIFLGSRKNVEELLQYTSASY